MSIIIKDKDLQEKFKKELNEKIPHEIVERLAKEIAKQYGGNKGLESKPDK